MSKKLIVFLVVFTLIASVVPAVANERTSDYIIPDVLLVRPVSFASIAVGFAVFVVSLPVAIPSGSVGHVWQALVADPAEYTFVRPVGDFDYRVRTQMPEKQNAQ
jgi:hypothetical protein